MTQTGEVRKRLVMKKTNMINAEFKERIKAICGLKPAGYYNPPAQHQPTNRSCQCAECVEAKEAA
jgi:hypothetical protein